MHDDEDGMMILRSLCSRHQASFVLYYKLLCGISRMHDDEDGLNDDGADDNTTRMSYCLLREAFFLQKQIHDDEDNNDSTTGTLLCL